ncbi:hypothetical protein BDW59DRAFT_53058 [Aspergillus cavernicola]|uniref:GPI anchored cell wall protein n=1 Tax=Aspergillus cavernicola TaxID=176166 RepID=A0ABR4IME2_9EURO
MLSSILLPMGLGLALATLTHADDASTTTAPYFGASWSSGDAELTIPSYTGTAASVVSVNAQETTYAINCRDGIATESCSIKDDWTMVQGISTFSISGVYTAFDWVPPMTVTLSEACTFTNYSISASCEYSMSYSGSSDGSQSSTSASTSDTFPTDSVTMYGLEVTGGLDKFDEPAATETPGAAAGGVWGAARALVTAAPVAVVGVVAML